MKIANVEDCVKELAQLEGITQTEANIRFNDCLSVITSRILLGGVTFKDMFTIKKSLRRGRKGIINGKEFESRDLYTLKITVGKKLSEMMN